MRPEFRRYFSDQDIQKLKEHLCSNAQIIEVKSVVDLCRDPKDNFLLALAKDSDADYLITGDNDLLVLKKVGKTKIAKMTEFEKLFN